MKEGIFQVILFSVGRGKEGSRGQEKDVRKTNTEKNRKHQDPKKKSRFTSVKRQKQQTII